jgi:hypothetical protein
VDGRGFASEYNILTTEDGERPEVYDRPIYEGYEESGISHQIFFNGKTEFGDQLNCVWDRSN